MNQEYKLSISYADNGTYLVTLKAVNIDPAGYHVADFESRSAAKAIQRAANWIVARVARTPRPMAPKPNIEQARRTC